MKKKMKIFIVLILLASGVAYSLGFNPRFHEITSFPSWTYT